ncbi:MOSC domain-containing protein [Agrobacterium larrymoorei]|uniref:MOSC domain-containing protein n=1 Tax=Agrobacterium larrymoorei TaxID=160699 RepID=A0AAF0KF30_9HYPH|nr:MOSC domain-containing protein [Agrobacterium larrymoorei]WHA42611.1 MOSC domain-containing protein [Agrobacterium larrymoorei]
METTSVVEKGSSATPYWRGTVFGIHICPRGILPMQSVPDANLLEECGIEGDRYARNTGYYSEEGFGHQISFFESEVLDTLRRDHNIEFGPEEHRRNITTRGVPLTHMIGTRFKIGDAVFLGTKFSTPCKHLVEVTGKEVFNPLINRSGLYARILKGGRISVGDVIEAC